MKMVLAASAVLLLTMDGNNAESTPTSTPPLEEAQLVVDEKTGSTIRTFSGRESVEFETLKRLINPDKSPGEWDKVRDPRRDARVYSLVLGAAGVSSLTYVYSIEKSTSKWR